MNTLIISGITIGIFLLSLMLGKKNKLVADKFLIIYLFYFVTSQVYFYFESYSFLQHSFWMLLGKGTYLLGGPLFFYYVYALTKPTTFPLKGYLLTLLPVFSYVLHFFYYYIAFEPRDLNIEHGLLYINGELPLGWTLFIVLFLVTDPFYLIWFFLLLKKYKERVMQSLSNTDRINLNWLNVLFYVWVVSAIVLFPVGILSLGRSWIPYSVVAWLLQLAYLVFIFVVGYYGFRQTIVFTNFEFYSHPRKSENKNASYERSGLAQEQAIQYHGQLLKLMKERKPYLDGEVTAQSLSKQLGISANHLSQVLNQEQKQNFFDFVNSYRVEEVKAKMKDSQFRNFTLLAIALESGFNSKTSFNTIFKKFTGQTPSQYYKSAV